MRVVRQVIKIDESKCDGCGKCVVACAEGALQIVDGKARLVSEVYCDGLGACIGDCPQGAITIEEREAEQFDEHAVAQHLAEMGGREKTADAAPIPSALGNWPVQLYLIPPTAPYLRGARLLIAADCVPFACGDFHNQILAGKVLLVGCPKLDDASLYVEKLSQIFAHNAPESVEIAFMEVPCCSGLVRIVQEALRRANMDLQPTLTRISIRGERLDG